VLLLLTATYSLSILDRFLLGILLPQIKAELQLNDSYLGLLSGIAFASPASPTGSAASSSSRYRWLCSVS